MTCRFVSELPFPVTAVVALTLICRLQSPPIVRGDVLSWLGFSLGSSVQAISDYFLDPAFVGSQVPTGHTTAAVLAYNALQLGRAQMLLPSLYMSS